MEEREEGEGNIEEKWRGGEWRWWWTEKGVDRKGCVIRKGGVDGKGKE